MSSSHTKVFISNRSQAVRLAKKVAFPDSVKEVDIIAIGNQRLIIPSGDSWSSWFDGPSVSDDFLSNRDQPLDQEREAL